MNCIEQVTNILDQLYVHGWDERNGGKLSYILTSEEVKSLGLKDEIIRTFHYDFDMTQLIGKYFIITGTGKYVRNCKQFPEVILGIMIVVDAHNLGLM